MNRRHAAVISVFLAVALLLGMVATIRTTQLGASASAPKASAAAAAVARRSRQLDRVEAALRKAAARKPPALPALPAKPAATTQLAAATTAPRTIYVRPAPIVHVVHRHGGEHEAEGGDGGGFDD